MRKTDNPQEVQTETGKSLKEEILFFTSTATRHEEEKQCWLRTWEGATQLTLLRHTLCVTMNLTVWASFFCFENGVDSFSL